MDMPSRLELEKLVEQLREELSDAQFETAAAIITRALMLTERGIEGERQAIRAERELLEQQQRAVEAERRALLEERRTVSAARAALEKERELEVILEAASDGVDALTSALTQASEAPTANRQQATDN
jgi:hypothetical protein